MSDQAKPQTAALDEIFRLRAALEWIVANVDEKKAAARRWARQNGSAL